MHAAYLVCPKPIHELFKFSRQNRLFIADLDIGEILEADNLIWDILQLCPQFTTDEIIHKLTTQYDLNAIHHALKQLHAIEEMGLLIGEKQVPRKRNRPRILVEESIEQWKSHNTYVASGYELASKEITNSLSRYADLFFFASTVESVSEGIFTIPRDKISFHVKQSEIDGIFIPRPPLNAARKFSLIPFHSNIPVITRLGSARGHGGLKIDSIQYLYAAMNEYHAFMVPAHFVIDFYSQYLLDLDCFHVIPNGVNSEFFQPMDKAEAKSKVAKILNRPDITKKKIVGFFGRFQPEKGAGTFIKMAENQPEYIFLVVVPWLHSYKLQELPPNLIYVEEQVPRNMLPWYLNAFDVLCFPSMSGEEVFGNAVLETMACGVPPIVPNFAGLPEVVGDAGIMDPNIRAMS